MSKNSLEEIKHGEEIIAIILRASYNKDGLSFFTPGSFSQQLGYMQHPAGKKIKNHVHNLVPREVQHTQEVLFIKSGKVKIDFYSSDKEYIGNRILQTGDTILLASGGHGFEMLEQTEMIEVKQGPYAGENDKVHF